MYIHNSFIACNWAYRWLVWRCHSFSFVDGNSSVSGIVYYLHTVACFIVECTNQFYICFGSECLLRILGFRLSCDEQKSHVQSCEMWSHIVWLVSNNWKWKHRLFLECWNLSTELGSVISQKSIILWSSNAYTSSCACLVTFQEVTQ
jgi:hypothetical protein